MLKKQKNVLYYILLLKTMACNNCAKFGSQY